MKKMMSYCLAAMLNGSSLFAAESLLMPETVWEQVKADLLATPEALAALKLEADQFLAMQPVSVTDKKTPPPSGDLHDYTSMAPYFWPNPDTPNGLPYIRKDGQTNPEFYTLDNMRLERLNAAVPTLILYSYVTGSKPHAEKAAQLLRVWFLDPETRMNPNLRYAQFIRGITDGRGIGIIDTNTLVFLLDAVTRLPESQYWTKDDYKKLQAWFADYVDWLTTHPFGVKEESEHNNHGSWYDAQVIAFSQFAGKKEQIAKRLARTRERIRGHIQPNGSQPGELVRTLSLTYSTFNLFAFVCVAEFARKEDINLWKEMPELAKALAYLKPYYQTPSTWTYPQISPFSPRSAMPMLTLCAELTDDPGLKQLVKQMDWPQYRILFSKSALTGRKNPVIGHSYRLFGLDMTGWASSNTRGSQI